MEKSSSQYDSFLFWRQPIPTLDLSELEDLGFSVGDPISRSKAKDKTTRSCLSFPPLITGELPSLMWTLCWLT
ncbi:hypothetical protein CCH79_00014093, partial [Gambusia affinis]